MTMHSEAVAGREIDANHMRVLHKICRGVVCEIGRGTVACAGAFPAHRYFGLDDDPQVIDINRAQYPGHFFETAPLGEIPVRAHTYLFNYALAEVPIGELVGIFSLTNHRQLPGCASARVVVCEGAERAPDDYYDALRSAGYRRVYLVEDGEDTSRWFLVGRHSDD